MIYQGRTEGMNQWKSGFAVKTEARTLAEALVGADVFFGLSVKGAVTQDMVKSMAAKPIIFAMANPDPEITVEEVAAVRSDAIMATGRSDYPNQINNVLGFPYIFRGALDVRAPAINMEMKIAAAQALAELAREDVPDEVAAAYGARPKYGPDYIIPVPFDPRLISSIPPAVAQAAMDTGVARKPIVDMDAYRAAIAHAARSDRRRAAARVRAAAPAAAARGLRRGRGGAGDPRRGELRAPGAWHGAAGRPRRRACARPRKALGIELGGGIEIVNAALSLAQRRLRGVSLRAAAAPRLSAARLPAPGQPGPQSFRRLHGGARRCRRHGDRRHPQFLGRARRRAPLHRSQARPSRHRRVAGAGARPHRAGRRHRGHRDAGRRGHRRRSRSRRRASRARSATSRGLRCSPSRPSAIRRASARERVQEAVRLLDQQRVDFEYDGEMAADVALNMELRDAYPFCRLSGPANVLIMPAFHSASISTKMLQELGGATVIGPLLVGLDRSVQIVPLAANDAQLVNMAALAAYNVSG